MSATLAAVKHPVSEGDFLVSAHADDELDHDQIRLRDLVESVQSALVVEDYPHCAKGPCVLVLQYDVSKRPVHALWGLAKE